MPPGLLLKPDHAWLLPSPEEEVEVLVDGSASEPDPQRLSVIQRAVADVQSLKAAATAYLDEFVDRHKLAGGSEWFLEGICSVPPDNEDEFTLQFSIEGDFYGLWTVKFKMGLERHWPVALARRNC